MRVGNFFWQRNGKKYLGISFLVLLLMGSSHGWHCLNMTVQDPAFTAETSSPLGNIPVAKAEAKDCACLYQQPILEDDYTEANPAPLHPVLRWTRVDGAVMYDVQILSRDEDDASYHPVMPPQRTYTTGIELELPKAFVGQAFYYRVCGLDPDGNLVGESSEIRSVPINLVRPFLERPVPTSDYHAGNGTKLLYPVYDWIPVPGAEQYEVEILNARPENPEGTRPSSHRIDVYRTSSSHQYDAKPRSGKKPIYWRVRALDAQGKPLGIWSEARPVSLPAHGHYEVATFGDSISHGGGSISYSPTDWDFSYQHDLDFPVINLAQSGDTSARGRARFDADVLPFHPRYLIILMGSNDLRAGTDAEKIIEDLEWMRQRCLANHIRPVFLTLPPLNPDHIQRAFQTPTAEDWQDIRDEVNRYIKAQVHVDITEGMADGNGNLKGDLALDGLHLDPAGKQMIAQAVNKAWPEIQQLPDSSWTKANEKNGERGLAYGIYKTWKNGY